MAIFDSNNQYDEAANLLGFKFNKLPLKSNISAVSQTVMYKNTYIEHRRSKMRVCVVRYQIQKHRGRGERHRGALGPRGGRPVSRLN